MPPQFALVAVVVGAALLFDFFNGFHDAANAIATIVVTRTLTPGAAVLLAGAANFVGYFVFGLAVAQTIGTGVVDVSIITLPILIATLAGAILWNIVTWLLGLPTSSSHALIGGLIGAAITASGFHVVILMGLLKIVAFIVVAPLLGWIGSVVFTNIVMLISHKAKRKTASKVFKRLQLLSATIYAISHGTNDAQKSMGIIALALVAGGLSTTFHLTGDHQWIVIACYAAISVGTMLGGWRIVRTMGTRITKIHAMEGFCAETASAAVILLTAHFGIPVSTTHVIAGSIMGVGTVEHAATVRWITARKIVWAWLLTIPLTAGCSALVYLIVRLFL